MSTSGSGRRTPSRGSRPAGRGGGPGRARTPRPRTTPVATRGAAPAAARPSPRLTSRAAILVLVLAVLAISASSLARAYLPLRDGMQANIEGNRAKEARNAEMEREIARQSTDEYAEQELRKLGYVRPGEVPYVAVDGGKPLDVEARLSDPSTVDPAEPKAWWDGAWQSMKVAGNPPRRTDPLPQTMIKDPEGAPAEESAE
ncbi:FtsB family cell division protein [Nocardioides plantarum]|uniref:Septum formation initiator family protein n=1 Tax=Nocardioides plantarum TaxID=29299 RepID=A0ABV5KA16_9ACTN|nr:septum formation initiator family protein [Nocardioides plantarum]